MTAILRMEGVGVRRRGRVILTDVSMSCERGTITWVRGANGAGKSTLLGVAMGLIAASWGSVRNQSADASYLPERFDPPSGMDVATYLKWIASTRGIPRRARNNAISDSLGSLGFAGSWGPMRLLSKGNLQRVGLAGALIGAPEFIVLDEPLTGIDAAGTDLVARAIDSAGEAGSSLLVVHHGTTPCSSSKSYWLEEGALHDAPSPATRYVIRAATNEDLPRLPITVTATPTSTGRVAVSTDSHTLEPALHALLAVGWIVEGVEQQ